MKAIKSATRAVALLALVALMVSVVMFRGLIADGVSALQYQPSPVAEQISRTVELTWLGKLYFYSSHPVIDQTNRASTECGVEKSTAILGCYANGIIYIYDIDNSELKGVEEVTAAHEMLHAAYSRLSEREREGVDKLLLAELESLSANKPFMDRMKAYGDLSEADRLNELHSIIATEVSNVSRELESYYDRYFVNREGIAKMYQGYVSVFFKLEKEAEGLTESYNNLVEERNRLVLSMNRQYINLQTRIDSAKRSSVVDAASAESINAEIDAYNARLGSVRQRMTDYDRRLVLLKEEMKESIAHQHQLNQAIDSSLAPAAQL